jgi:isochorismate synthase EntC/branched-subunit amino acid aminotransferase/4-amino-4-deoxychorismate lyase
VTGTLGAAPAVAPAEVSALRRMRARFRSVPLGAGPDPWTATDLLARRARGPVAALIGEWADGDAVLAADPLLVVDATDYGVWDCQPVVSGPVPAGAVGGGWFGWIDADGTSHVAFYDQVLRRHNGLWYAESLVTPQHQDRLADGELRLRALLAQPVPPPDWTVGVFRGAERDPHLAAVEQAVAWIRAGDIYQANICTRLHAAARGGAAQIFAAVGRQLQPRFAAHLSDGGGRAVVAMSPELFLRRRGRTVTTSPIKGTRPRTGLHGATALRASVKDAAENVMIVDLMRNDLGRVCATGSVQVTDLLTVQPHPGVWHLVSTVTGGLRTDVDDAALLAATFPPGSVTGAPKLRAGDAIAELEAEHRGAFTGAVGFAGPLSGLELAVTIRTFEFDGDRVALGVGGGITADSVPMLEWQECLDKAAPLVTAAGSQVAGGLSPDRPATTAQRAGGLLETVLVLDGIAVRLDDHLARLDRSARELYGRGVPAAVSERARSAAGRCGAGRFALRIHAPADGDVSIAVAAAGVPPGASHLRVVVRPDGLWRHKWADRDALAMAEKTAEATLGTAAGASAAPVFVADDSVVLETSRGNVFLIEADGTLVTAPLRDDLLPGVTRRALLDLAHDEGRPVQLRPFTVAQLGTTAAFWTSSLSGAVPIASVDRQLLPRRDELIAGFAAALVDPLPGGGSNVR